jgi:hypothetical protein
MTGLNLFAGTLNRLASRSSRRKRVRAERLSDAEPQRAFALFAAAAEAGDAEAAFKVGEFYLDGKTVLGQPAEAARWYRRAAEDGHLGAQVRLAQLHLLGLPEDAVDAAGGLFETAKSIGVDYCAAMRWAKRAADAGVPDAQAILGYILSSGPEELRDPDAALKLYRESAQHDCPQGRLGYALMLMTQADTAEKSLAAHDELVLAAAAGLPTAHYLLGAEAERGAGTAQDDTKAREHYTIAAEAGLASAQTRLGLLLLEGRGGPADLLNGESWLRRATLSGDIEAAALLGDIYARGGEVPPNYLEAAHWFRTAAERGHKSAARALGTLYLTGAGVGRDADEAAVWFKRAAEAGDPEAQVRLATLLQTGAASTMAEDPPPVHEWFERAAEQGDLIGAFNYAVCLAEGIGVPRDDQQAARWLKRAAEGVVDAQYWYGRMLAEGRGVTKDDAEAAIWYARAAEHGHSVAALMLARCAMHGLGRSRDIEDARRWYTRAASLGVIEASDELAELDAPTSAAKPTANTA